MKSEKTALLEQAPASQRKDQAKVWAGVFGISIFVTHLFYLISDFTIRLLVELVFIILVIIYLVSVKRRKPTPKQLNGVCIIVALVGVIEMGRLIAFHILNEIFLPEKHIWKVVVSATCVTMIFICVSGLMVSLIQYKKGIIKENPELSSLDV